MNCSAALGAAESRLPSLRCPCAIFRCITPANGASLSCGSKCFYLKSASSVLNSGRDLRVAFLPVAPRFHLVPGLSSTQDFYASVRSHSHSSFIHVFPILFCCFSGSLLLIASNCVSAETAAVSSTCNLSNPSTKFNCYCICNAALRGSSLAAYNVSWILIEGFLALRARFKLLEVAGCKRRETVTLRALPPVIWKQGDQLSLLPASWEADGLWKGW